jgi:hypothetical protein
MSQLSSSKVFTWLPVANLHICLQMSQCRIISVCVCVCVCVVGGVLLACFLEVSFRKYWHFLVQSSDCKSIRFSGLKYFFLSWKSAKLIINLKHTITSAKDIFCTQPQITRCWVKQNRRAVVKGHQERRSFSLGHLGAFPLKSAGKASWREHPKQDTTQSPIIFVRKLSKITSGFPDWVILASKITIYRFPRCKVSLFTALQGLWCAPLQRRGLLLGGVESNAPELRQPLGPTRRLGVSSDRPPPSSRPPPPPVPPFLAPVRPAGTHRCPAARSGAAGRCWPAGRAAWPLGSTSHPWGCNPTREPGPSSPPPPAPRSRARATAGWLAAPYSRRGQPDSEAQRRGRRRPASVATPRHGWRPAPSSQGSTAGGRAGCGGSRSASASLGPGSAIAAASRPPPPPRPSPSLRLEPSVRWSRGSEERHSSAPGTD